MLTPEQQARWDKIEACPLPTGVGEIKSGLCAVARIAYALTGMVTDDLACVSQICRAALISANDHLPTDLRERLGRTDVRNALLATTPQDDDRLRWVVAEQAHQSALRALD